MYVNLPSSGWSILIYPNYDVHSSRHFLFSGFYLFTVPLAAVQVPCYPRWQTPMNWLSLSWAGEEPDSNKELLHPSHALALGHFCSSYGHRRSVICSLNKYSRLLLSMGPRLLLGEPITSIVGHIVEPLHYWAYHKEAIFSKSGFFGLQCDWYCISIF